jgi:hypothetical protein
VILANKAHNRQQCEVNFPKALRAERDQFSAEAARVGDEPAHLDAHAVWSEWLQVIRAALKLDCRASEVVAQQVIAADTDLQDALVERPDRTWLGAPDQLQCLVAFEIFALIELLDAPEQFRCWLPLTASV